MASFKEHIDTHNLPEHVAVIMDGNGRWAKNKGAARIFGHRNAIEAVRQVIEGAGEIGIKYLTLYAFSTENWGRPKEEVDALMELLVNTLQKEIEMLHKNKVRLKTIGDIGQLPKDCRENLTDAIESTKNNTGLTLLIALNYSGRREILKAVSELAMRVKRETLEIDEIDEQLFASFLDTKKIPDPALLIRTSGEMRISNFLL
ncbi:MAG: polyprenyl diphosphate synthase, partial [Cyclobacteriaceae bacterium]|nr:polyprenyl diphosphate synthase [Cyclobacteriaceae bacterium]